MKKNALFLAVVCVVLMGCQTANRLNRLNIGMTKSEVLSALGKPNNISATQDGELLEYKYPRDFMGYAGAYSQQYWIVLQNGQVTKYGPAINFVSPEERAAYMQAQATQRQASAQTLANFGNSLQQQEYQQQQLELQRRQQLLNSVRSNNVNCTTNYVGNTAYTNCN